MVEFYAFYIKLGRVFFLFKKSCHLCWQTPWEGACTLTYNLASHITEMVIWLCFIHYSRIALPRDCRIVILRIIDEKQLNNCNCESHQKIYNPDAMSSSSLRQTDDKDVVFNAGTLELSICIIFCIKCMANVPRWWHLLHEPADKGGSTHRASDMSH